MVSLLIAMLVMAGSYSPSGNSNQVDAPTSVAVSSVNDVPAPTQPETDISVSDVE